MKTQFLKQAIYISLFASFYNLSAQNSSSGFKAKFHKDTVVNKSNLKAVKNIIPTVNSNSKFSNLKPTSFKSSSTLNFNNQVGSDGAKIIKESSTGLPIFISHTTPSSTNGLRIGNDNKNTAVNYLNSISKHLQIAQPEKHFMFLLFNKTKQESHTLNFLSITKE